MANQSPKPPGQSWADFLRGVPANKITLTGATNVEFDEEEGTITFWRGIRRSKGQVREVDGHVSASVETGGNLRTHPTVTRAAAGFVLTGTRIGAAFWKKSGGGLFLFLEGREWAELVPLDPKAEREARVLAQRVNLVAKMAREAAGSAEQLPAATDSVDAVGQLERLANLRDSGALTEEEFAAKKQRILSR